MEEYPSNSFKSKQEKQEEKPVSLTPVVEHEVKVRKKGAMQKFADAFIAEDLSSVKTYVIKELLIPGIKRMFLSSLEMLLNGKGYSSNKKDRQVTTVSYRDYYEKEAKRDSYRNDYLDFDDIIYQDRGDAEYVRDQMLDILRQYRVVRVSDMFELSRRPAPYTGNSYGWTDMTLARVVPVRDGYMIKMPRPIPIDRI